MEFGFHALPVGFGEALKIHVVAGEVFEACQVEGCGAVVAGWGVELGEVVGDLLHHDSFAGDGVLMVLSCGFGDDGVHIDCVDHVVEVLDFGTVQAADDRRVGVAYVTSCQVCGVEWVDFCLPVEAGEGWCDECAIHEGVLLSVVVGVVVVSRVCRLQPHSQGCAQTR